MRRRKDGSPAAAPRRHRFNHDYITKLRPETKPFNVWDTLQRGLVLIVQPSGFRSFKVVYSKFGKARWFHIGDIPLADARRVAGEIRLASALGDDPVADRRAALRRMRTRTRTRAAYLKITPKKFVIETRKRRERAILRAVHELGLIQPGDEL